MAKRFLFVLLVSLKWTLTCASVTSDTLQESKWLPNYIGVFKDRLSLSLILCTRGTSVNIHNLSDQKQQAKYAPNNIINLGFGINYKWLALELAFRVPFLDRQDKTRGNTRAFYVEARMIRRKYWFHAFLQSNRGYYLSNVTEFDPHWFDHQKDYFFRRDISSSVAFLSGNYIFNDAKFSYKAVSNQFEWQKKSAGSFLLGGTIANYNCHADTSLLPLNARRNYSAASDITSINVLLSGTNVGYLHTFVIKKKLFIHLGLIQTFGLRHFQYSKAGLGTQEAKTGLGHIIDARFALGYNSDRTFGGIYYNLVNFNESVGNQNLMDLNFQYIKLFFGKRLHYSLFKKRSG